MLEYAKNIALNLLDGFWKEFIFPAILVVGVIVSLFYFTYSIS